MTSNEKNLPNASNVNDKEVQKSLEANKLDKNKGEGEIYSSKYDTLLWAVVIVLFIASVVLNHYFQEISAPIRISGFLILAGVLLYLAFLTSKGKKFWIFAKDARMELRKVVCPTRQETVRITAFISGLVVLMAILMWGVDSLLMWLIGLITG
jgi:preprotein translocase subunit SecE